jgi:two-component system, sensor histidine kinase PdtaS
MGNLGWITSLTDKTRHARGVLPWASALAIVAASLAARFILGPLLQHEQFLASFLAITVTAFFFGWRQAALVLVLSLTGVYYFFLPPPWSFRLEGPPAYVALIGFAALGACDIALVDALVIAVRRLRSAVQMQETLFRELQHRVANNMQVLATMLERARYSLDGAATAEILDHASARIMAMAQLHRRLHDPNAYAKGLTPLLQDLLAELFQGLPVIVSLDICDDVLSFNQLTSITLLVSEAAMNAAKHVFRRKQGSTFEVTLTEGDEGRLRLVIRDDGPGIAAAADAGPRRKKLGTSIMEAFAQQLGGTLAVGEFPGATLTVEFASARQRLSFAASHNAPA